ncbi:MAG: hypothetical protein AABY22_02750 [Nanoarchaeota archaeon]
MTTKEKMPKNKKIIIIGNQIKQATDTQLVWWIQDINRIGGEEKYSKEFQKLVHKEICKRGKLK